MVPMVHRILLIVSPRSDTVLPLPLSQGHDYWYAEDNVSTAPLPCLREQLSVVPVCAILYLNYYGHVKSREVRHIRSDDPHPGTCPGGTGRSRPRE